MAYNIFVLDPAKWEIWLAGQPFGSKPNAQKIAKNVKAWAIQEKADLAFNLTTFNMATGEADTYVKARWKDLSYGHEGHSALIDLGNGNQCHGYSNGIINGVVTINRPFGGARTRNGIGLTDKSHVIIAQTGHNSTEVAFCNMVNQFVRNKGQKVVAFVLEDGGGSTQEFSTRSGLIFAPEGGRNIPNVVCVKYRGTPTISSPVYNGSKGADTELIQTILGGIAADGDGGSATATRITKAQVFHNFPTKLRCGICSAFTAKALGVKYIT